jgi:hypothetical protein
MRVLFSLQVETPLAEQPFLNIVSGRGERSLVVLLYTFSIEKNIPQTGIRYSKRKEFWNPVHLHW